MYNLRLRATQRSAILALSGPTKGQGSVSDFFQVSASGGVGNSGIASAGINLLSTGVGEQKPTGVGYYRLSCEIAVASGFVGTFGDGKVQVKFAKAGKGLLAPVGVGAATIVSAYGIGASGTVAGVGAVALPFHVAAYGGTPPFDGWVYGAGAGRVAMRGSGAGLASVAGNGVALIRQKGAAFGSQGRFGTGTFAVCFSASGVGGRGAFAAGTALILIAGKGTGSCGSSAVGVASQFLRANGVGSVTAMVSGVGAASVRFKGLAYGGRVFDYPDAGKDLFFVRTRATEIFVRTEL